MLQKKTTILVIISLLFFLLPASAPAEDCYDIRDKADQTFEAAREAAKQKNYARAAELFERAQKYYRSITKGECSCPKIVASAKENIQICKANAANSRQALKNQRKYEAEKQVVATYNRAKDKYNQGNTYARNQQWANAVTAFEKAASIWRNIASTESENGKRAKKMAEKADKLADLARQRKQ